MGMNVPWRRRYLNDASFSSCPYRKSHRKLNNKKFLKLWLKGWSRFDITWLLFIAQFYCLFFCSVYHGNGMEVNPNHKVAMTWRLTLQGLWWRAGISATLHCSTFPPTCIVQPLAPMRPRLPRDPGAQLIEKFWLEFRPEKPLEFWLEIPHTKKTFKNG